MTGRVEQLQREFDLTVRWTAFPLHPETPDEGRSLEELFARRPVDIPGMLANLKATADQLDLPFGVRSMTYNSRRAQELGKWAEAQGRGEAFHIAAFRAYFAEGLNIAQPKVLMELAERSGLHRDQAQKALEERPFEQAVDEDWSRSRGLGISAVPTFKIGDKIVVGAQPYNALQRLVQSCNLTNPF